MCLSIPLFYGSSKMPEIDLWSSAVSVAVVQVRDTP